MKEQLREDIGPIEEPAKKPRKAPVLGVSAPAALATFFGAAAADAQGAAPGGDINDTGVVRGAVEGAAKKAPKILTRPVKLKTPSAPNTPGSYFPMQDTRLFPIPGKEPGYEYDGYASTPFSFEVTGPTKGTLEIFPKERGEKNILQVGYSVGDKKFVMSHSFKGQEAVSFPLEFPAGVNHLKFLFATSPVVINFKGLTRTPIGISGHDYIPHAPETDFLEDPARPQEFTRVGKVDSYGRSVSWEGLPSADVPQIGDLDQPAIEEIPGMPGMVKLTYTSERGECTTPLTYVGFAKAGASMPIRFKRNPSTVSKEGAKGPDDIQMPSAWAMDAAGKVHFTVFPDRGTPVFGTFNTCDIPGYSAAAANVYLTNSATGAVNAVSLPTDEQFLSNVTCVAVLQDEIGRSKRFDPKRPPAVCNPVQEKLKRWMVKLKRRSAY